MTTKSPSQVKVKKYTMVQRLQKINATLKGLHCAYRCPKFSLCSISDTCTRPPWAGANAKADGTDSDAVGHTPTQAENASLFPRRAGQPTNAKT